MVGGGVICFGYRLVIEAAAVVPLRTDASGPVVWPQVFSHPALLRLVRRARTSEAMVRRARSVRPAERLLCVEPQIGFGEREPGR